MQEGTTTGVNLFPAHDARTSSAVMHVLQTILKITVSCLVRHPNNSSNKRDKRGFDLRPFAWSGVPWTETTPLAKGRRNDTWHNRRKSCRTWLCSRWYQHSLYTRYMGTMEGRYFKLHPFAPRTRRDASERSLRTINTRSRQTVSKSTAALQLELRVLVTWPVT